MLHAFIASLLLVFLAAPAFGRVYDRCSLARELNNLGVPKYEIGNWVCIAQHESTFNSYTVGPANYDGSQDYGIFQINNRYWCSPPFGEFSHNICRIGCTELLNDSIEADLRCAQLIVREQGWGAWSTWQRCSGNIPNIYDCF